MDMTYLLWVQELRNSIDAVMGNVLVSRFMEEFSYFAITWLVFVPVFVYWCLNKKNGLFLWYSMGISWFINGFVKLTVCAYRPWIRDARILPAGDAIKTAGGYSFPSGHTMWSSPVYGGMAVLAGKTAKWFSWLCIFAILLTAFSRNYLGVHTPQDVVVGTTLGLCSVWIASRIVAHPDNENLLLMTGLVLAVTGMAYVVLKSYPMDYNADGKLLVDPVAMMNDTFHGIGMFAGLMLGRYVEKTYINFRSTGFSFKGILLAVIGFVPYYCLVFNFVKTYTFIMTPLTELFTARGAYFTIGFLTSFYALAVWPFVLRIFAGKE